MCVCVCVCVCVRVCVCVCVCLVVWLRLLCQEFYQEFRSQLNFVSVYIAEAHAQVCALAPCRDLGLSSPLLDVCIVRVTVRLTGWIQDKWPISSARYNGDRGAVLIPEPTSNEQRCALAAAYVRNYEYPMPFLVDPVADDFERVFAPWPIRFYIIDAEGKLDFIPEPKNCEYSVEELRKAMCKHVPEDALPAPDARIAAQLAAAAAAVASDHMV